MSGFNFYEDGQYAEAYSKLEVSGTYYLAYRDLPQIFAKHITGWKALDFGCGAGRSTRFLQKLGFVVTGIDISEEMLKKAKEKDPAGDYRLVHGDDFSELTRASFDLILSAFPFDNIPEMNRKIGLFTRLSHLLNSSGCIVNLVSSPEIYVNEWLSFSTKDFPENRLAKSGDEVKVLNRAIADSRPVTDIFMTNESYRDVYEKSGLKIVETYRPLGMREEPYDWVNEMVIAPWVIYVLGHQ